MTGRETLLVTGGTGFIGAYSIKSFQQAGYEVSIFDISTDEQMLHNVGVEPPIEIIEGDITEESDINDAIEQVKPDKIVHLAAVLTDTVEECPATGVDVNVVGTNNVLEATRQFDTQIDRLVFASSGAVYAPPQKYNSGSLDEDALLLPETHYGGMKAYNEFQARAYERTYGIQTAAIRPQIVYGPYRKTGTGAILTKLIEAPARGESFQISYGNHLLDWNYIKDVAQAFKLAVDASDDQLTQSVYNIGGEALTIAEAAEVVRGLIPDADIEVTSDGTLPWAQNIDISAAKEDLGYQPKYDFQRGACEYINQIREHSGLPKIPQTG